MLNNQDFAQSRDKSLGRSDSSCVIAFPSTSKELKPDLNQYVIARKLLKETIQTIFIDGWNECMKINKMWEN